MDPSMQPRTELSDSAGRSSHADDGRLAPILTHLNADSSWLCQMPAPESVRHQTGREYYNILIDPWLVGSEVDVGRWFAEHWHTTPSKFKSIVEVEEFIRGRGEATAPGHESQAGQPTGSQTDTGQTDSMKKSPIDFLVISYEMSDHCHKETLLEVDRDVPVLAAKKAANLIRSWKHFHTVKDIVDINEAEPDWRRTSLDPLPDWIGIGRVPSGGSGLSYIHGAILISFDLDQDSGAQAILYTPHGIVPEDAAFIRRAQPPLQTLALLHGANEVSIGRWSWGKLNLGVPNGLKLQLLLQPKYWIGTHDENKKAGGLLSYALRGQAWTVSEISKLASKGHHKEGEESESSKVEDKINFVTVENGESMVLR